MGWSDAVRAHVKAQSRTEDEAELAGEWLAWPDEQEALINGSNGLQWMCGTR